MSEVKHPTLIVTKFFINKQNFFDFCNNTLHMLINEQQERTCLLSQLLPEVTHILQFLHHMFNVSALLLYDTLKLATALTGATPREKIRGTRIRKGPLPYVVVEFLVIVLLQIFF